MKYKAILKQGYHEIEFIFNTISELTEFMQDALLRATGEISFIVSVVEVEDFGGQVDEE